MDYLNTSYPDSSSYIRYSDPSMDPGIKRSVSPLSVTDSWQYGRYLAGNKSPFPLCPTVEPVMSGLVAPFHPSQFHRADSPSYTNPSSTCSSSLSPPRDTDYCHIRSPPTPSDAPLPPQYGILSPYPQVYEFTGMADGCVNLGDIHPMQDLSMNCYEDSIQEFDVPMRTCSLPCDDNNVSYPEWAEEEVLPHTKGLGLGLDTVEVKEEEILIPNTTENFHRYEAGDIEQIHDFRGLQLKTESNEGDNSAEEDDDEYTPYKRSRTGSTKPARTSRSHKRRILSQAPLEAKRSKTTMADSVVARSGAKPPLQGAKGQYACSDCPKVTFKDKTSLDNHIRKQHTRPFICIFEFAGCRSTFANKNEWKRHCASQHIVLQYWVCQQDGCAQVSNEQPSSPKKPSSSGGGRSSKRSDSNHHRPSASLYHNPLPLPNGTIFNRKDLYTQHLRRMHIPAHLKNKVKSKTHVPEWEEQQRVCQNKAVRTRCQLPTHMLCPAPGCNMHFDGANAWDERMEHVAKHLEKAAANAEPSIHFNGNTDNTLIDWATSPAIGILKRGDGGRWLLLNPLRATGHQAAASSSASASASADDRGSDEDAEGEDDTI